jgi:hypothetical protein
LSERGTFRARPGSTHRTRNKDRIMKLDSNQVKQTLKQLNAQVIPDDHPVIGQLCDMFGDHTFFVDDIGLKVLEPMDSAIEETNSSEVVSVADWSDATATSLRAHEPQPTGVVVIFDPTKH